MAPGCAIVFQVVLHHPCSLGIAPCPPLPDTHSPTLPCPHSHTFSPSPLRLPPPPYSGSNYGNDGQQSAIINSLTAFRCLWLLAFGNKTLTLEQAATQLEVDLADCGTRRHRALAAWAAPHGVAMEHLDTKLHSHAWYLDTVVLNANCLVREVLTSLVHVRLAQTRQCVCARAVCITCRADFHACMFEVFPPHLPHCLVL